MKKLYTLTLSVIALLLAVICLGACSFTVGDAPDGPSEEETDTDENAPGGKKKKYLITFETVTSTVSRLVTEGELPTPPVEEPLYSNTLIGTIIRWDKEIVPVTEATTYKAIYDYRTRYYTVTYKSHGSEIVDDQATFNSAPKFPANIEIPEGYEFVEWYGPAYVNGDITYQAIYSKYLDAENMKKAIENGLMGYSKNFDEDDNKGSTSNEATAFLSLALEEFYYPQSGPVRDRVLAHLRNLISGGVEPQFEALPLWSYPLCAGAIAVAKATPSVWGELTKDEIEKLDLIMRCFAVISCFATDDDNTYETGPGLGGNYHKGWNPNYRLANVGPIIFCTLYFGSADAVNQIFAGFDYDVYMQQFETYGFTRVADCWSSRTHVAQDEYGEPVLDEYGNEIVVLGCRDLFTNGGDAWCYASTNNGKLTAAGTGVGVKDNIYTYLSCDLNNLEGIFNKLLENNYDGGVCRDEQYDSTGENKIGWTDKENAEKLEVGPNPMLGFEGMMLELGLTNRSSIGYGSHDFMLVMGIMEAMKALGAYDPTEHLDMYRKVIAGNEDFLYKCEVGFYSGVKVWYTGGEWRITRYDESEFGNSYWIWKFVWKEYYPDHPNKAVAK